MSRFVSAGTDQEPVERDDEWLKAQQELEANRRRKEEQAQQQDGKSLYDILQANKAAKQDAFEESIRLKNQFRSLDNDEVDFLDSVLESTRAKEAAIQRETDEQLDLFRQQREEAERAARIEDGIGEEPHVEAVWQSTGRKKRKAVEKEALKGVKVPRVSSSAADKVVDTSSASSPTQSKEEDTTRDIPKHQAKSSTATPTGTSLPKQPLTTTTSKAGPAPSGGLGLIAYSSDDD